MTGRGPNRTKIVVHCDRADGLRRAAVFRGGDVTDLYVDRLDQPDMTGAVVGARRIRSAGQGRAAWFDAGLDQHIYVEGAGSAQTQSGFVALRIKTTLSEGKAYQAVPATGLSATQAGLLTPPPCAWERALADLADHAPDVMHFTCAADAAACRDSGLVPPSVVRLADRRGARDALAPDERDSAIDPAWDAAREDRIELGRSAELFVERTRAMIVIDVNAGQRQDHLAVNRAAAGAVAIAARLRNWGGIIVVDAIKMKNRTDRDQLVRAFVAAFATDPAGAQVLGLTKAGLIEILRQRRGPAIDQIEGML